jgi:hypothetical protein
MLRVSTLYCLKELLTDNASSTSGYKAFATPSPTPLRDFPEVISELVTISRSAFVKAYALIIVTLVCESCCCRIFMMAI